MEISLFSLGVLTGLALGYLSWRWIAKKGKNLPSPFSLRSPISWGSLILGGFFALAGKSPSISEALWTMAFLSFLLVMAWIDLYTLELPDELTYGLFFLGLVGAFWTSFPLPLEAGLAVAFLAAGSLALIRGYGSM